MLFNSIDYFLFFPIIIFLYYALKYKQRILMLLIASCYFYMFLIPKYIIILAVTIVLDYFLGIYIEKITNKNSKKLLLTVSIIVNLSILAFFKYFNFLNENISQIFTFLGHNWVIKNLDIILPIGLSFHIFQSIAYVIEVYRGNIKAEKSFSLYALYVMFFPQLVAGPIERPQNLLPQLAQEQKFKWDNFLSGTILILTGLFKKVAIADWLSGYVGTIYNNAGHHNGVSCLIATYAFAIQIYCDFSGYTDMARGSARILGIELMENFKSPYFSTSITQFWRRWHISLSFWLRDYLYISLGGNRVGKIRTYINLFLTMLLGGLWHGASWNFVIWGGLHGFFLAVHKILSPYLTRFSSRLKTTKVIYNVLSILLTFHLVCFTWIFFRAPDFHTAKVIITNIFSNPGRLFLGSYTVFFHCVFGVFVLFLAQLLKEKYFFVEKFFKHKDSDNFGLKIAFIVFAIFSIVLLGNEGGSGFIYFQF